ncbi:hypothetical protein HOY80DRAFT_967345 [Tuber brumale]|nr:hypothetical protein HOY80DRAFT_967345 [Tuber brumale]
MVDLASFYGISKLGLTKYIIAPAIIIMILVSRDRLSGAHHGSAKAIFIVASRYLPIIPCAPPAARLFCRKNE